MKPMILVKLQKKKKMQAEKNRKRGAVQIDRFSPLRSKCFPKILQENCRRRGNRFRFLVEDVSLWNPLSLRDKPCAGEGRERARECRAGGTVPKQPSHVFSGFAEIRTFITGSHT